MSVSVVTGGLGYIGQSLVSTLKGLGQYPVVIDVRSIPSQVADVEVIRGSIGESRVWEQLRGRTIDTVYHCAGLISVAESVNEPAAYFKQNVSEGLSMLNLLPQWGSPPLVFSSSAAIYGHPDDVPIPEDGPKRPLSPYGLTKWHFEQILQSYQEAYHQPYVALRYFNAAGCVPGVRELHDPETHLVPLVLRAFRERRSPTIFGSDYPTSDGTAVRDYVHVGDLVEAHIKAAQHLRDGGPSCALNLGSGRGATVREVMGVAEAVTGVHLPPVLKENRAGDAAVLVADISEAHRVLGWKPTRSDMTRIVSEVWQGMVNETLATGL